MSGEWDAKVRENRLRRMAARQGIALTKVRRIDRRAKDYGTWQLVDADHDVVLTGLTTDEVEHYLEVGSTRALPTSDGSSC